MPRTDSSPAGTALAASLAPAIVGLAASAMLAVDYLRPAPVFCAEGGCAAVRRSAIAGALGAGLPVAGIAGFLAIGIAALVAGRRARAAQLVLASLGGVAGASLIAVQASIHAFCPFCVAADASAVACLAAAAWRFARGGGDPPRALVYGGAGGLLVAAVVPLAIGVRSGAARAVPAVIRAEIARTPPGEATVVDFLDFECPFCRMTNAALEPLLEAHAGRVRWVRRQVPLRSHPHAIDAARAACCGEILGQGEAITKALFATPVEDLTREGCEKVARSVGLALGPYRACVADPKTDARIEADHAEFEAAGGYALPTVWIDETQLVGAQPRDAFARALDRALSRR